MSQASAQAIAQNYVQLHYPRPQQLIPAEVQPHFQYTLDFVQTYSCVFRQDLGHGVIGPNLCIVEVDTIMGQVVSYIGYSHIPVLISPKPRLSAQQALLSAMQDLLSQPGQDGNVEGLFVSKPDLLGGQRLVYHVTFTGIGIANPKQLTSYTARVDANDGSVLNWDVLTRITPHRNSGKAQVLLGIANTKSTKRQPPPQQKLRCELSGRPLNLNYPPLLIDGHPYLYVGYLAYGVQNAHVGYRATDKTVSITGSKQRATFHLTSKSYTLGGKQSQMNAPLLPIDKHIYVPLEIAAQVMPFHINYSPQQAVVRFIPVSEAQTTVFKAGTQKGKTSAVDSRLSGSRSSVH
jgi:predicted small secreted protein